MSMYPNGYTIICMDFSNDLRSSSGLVYGPVQTGVLKMDLKWRDPLPEPIVMVSEFYYDSELQVHSDRSVSYDYSA